MPLTKDRPSWHPYRVAAGRVAALYLLLLLLMLWFEDKLIFPGCEPGPPPEPGFAEDVWAEANGRPVHGWWLAPPDGWTPDKGAVLFSHGNGGNVPHWAHGSGKRYRDALGVGVLVWDYPGYGRSPGPPGEAAVYAGADAMYRWLTETNGVPPDRVVLAGESLGGAAAIELATRRPCRAVVATKAFASIPEVAQHLYPIFPCSLLMKNRFPNERRLRGVTRPVFLAHGTADGLVPYAHALRLKAAAAGPVELFTDEGGGHEVYFGPAFDERLKAFLAEYAP